MALKKITDINKSSILSDIKNNTGTARVDEYYFLTREIIISDLHDLAYKKDSIISVTTVNETVSKMIYINSLV